MRGRIAAGEPVSGDGAESDGMDHGFAGGGLGDAAAGGVFYEDRE